MLLSVILLTNYAAGFRGPITRVSFLFQLPQRLRLHQTGEFNRLCHLRVSLAATTFWFYPAPDQLGYDGRPLCDHHLSLERSLHLAHD